MERILIVEDNKALAKLIAKKIDTTLNFKVDVAYSLSEAKLFLKRYAYFVTLLDLNLPDAPNGEIVDYVLSKNNKAIVLSGNIDKEFRKTILKKNIIDYVNKSGANEINYIIQELQRLSKNKKHKILVVDDSMVFRKQLKGMLENLFFKVITVAHGEEALGMLNAHPDISLVLTDYNMPVVNGLELTKEIRKNYTKNELSIIALSSNEDDEINAMFLKSGANDYIKKTFSKEEFSCRIHNAIEALENIHLITNHSNRDFLTGLYNQRYFLQVMNNYFLQAKENSENFALALVGIDNFKHLSDTYTHETVDEAIIALSEILRSNTNQNDLIARFSDDEFCILIKNTTKQNAYNIFQRLRDEVQKHLLISRNQEIRFSISIGSSLTHEDTLDESMSNLDMLLYKAKQQGQNQILID